MLKYPICWKADQKNSALALPSLNSSTFSAITTRGRAASTCLIIPKNVAPVDPSAFAILYMFYLFYRMYDQLNKFQITL